MSDHPTDPHSSGNATTTAVAVALGAAATAFLLGVLFTWGITTTGDNLASDRSATTTSAPEPAFVPPPAAVVPEPRGPVAPLEDPEDLAALGGEVFPDLQAFVERERELGFLLDVPVVLLDDEEFVRRVVDAIDPRALAAEGWMLQVLGLVEPDVDVAEVVRDVLAEHLGGIYLPDSGTVVARGAERSPSVDTVIVHELTHALDDQWFGIDRPELAERDDESAFGLESVVEGSARVVERAFAAEAGVDLDASSSGHTSGVGDLVAAVVPAYDLAERFVGALLSDGGTDRLDEAFTFIPLTSKEVIEPSRYLEGFVPVEVPAPPAPGEVVDEGAFGQINLWRIVAQVRDEPEAELLAATWMGDRYVIWVEAALQCLRVDTAPGSPEGGAELAEALREWADELPLASVEELRSGLVRFTTCAPLPPPAGGSSPA